MTPIIRLSLLESARRQVHLILLLLAVILLIVPAIIAALNMGTPDRVIKDLDLTLMGLYGLGLTLFLACSAIPGEVERHTIYPLLARPLSRLSYLVAKFLAMAIIVSVSQLILGGCVYGSMWIFLKAGDLRIFTVVGSIVLEDFVLAAATLFFSTMASPVLAAVLGIFVYMVGGLSPVFIDFFLKDEASHFTAAMAHTLKMLMPQFDFFQLKDAVVHNDPLPMAYLTSMYTYAFTWIAFLLLLGGLAFERKDL